MFVSPHHKKNCCNYVWGWTYFGDHFAIYTDIKSLCCIPATNIMLYVNDTSIKKNREMFRGNDGQASSNSFLSYSTRPFPNFFYLQKRLNDKEQIMKRC